MPKKTHCKRGHELTPENVYYGADRHRRCRACQLSHQKHYRDADSDHTYRLKRDARLRQRYGIDYARKMEMLKEQGGCAICRTNDPKGFGKGWHVDHNHETGKIRGILCARCNLLLGMLKEDLSFMRAIVSYLQQ